MFHRTRPRSRPLILAAAYCAAAVFGFAEALAPRAIEPGIQDNSFLIEEAYNQEWGVVQHINLFTRTREGDWTYTLTQEWPLRGPRHQVSYSLPLERLGSDAGSSYGFGDVALNYRYQLVGDGAARLAVAPRISLLVPAGDEAKGFGAGGTGFQTNIPLSLVILDDALVMHLNAGATWTPSAHGRTGASASTTAVNLGTSLVWLARRRINLLLETVWGRSEVVVARSETEREDSFLVSPGVRCAFNFKSGLQIVPGLAVPLGLGPSHGARSLLAYLSFEHPFKHRR